MSPSLKLEGGVNEPKHQHSTAFSALTLCLTVRKIIRHLQIPFWIWILK